MTVYACDTIVCGRSDDGFMHLIPLSVGGLMVGLHTSDTSVQKRSDEGCTQLRPFFLGGLMMVLRS